jgi:protease II
MGRLALICIALPALVSICHGLARSAELPPAPATPRKPVTDEYHGVKVVDDYRWLENAGDSAVRQWTEAQNRHTRALLALLVQRRSRLHT